MKFLKLFEDLNSSTSNFSYTQEDIEDFILEFLDDGFKLNGFKTLYFNEDFSDISDGPFEEVDEENPCYPGYWIKLVKDDSDYLEEDGMEFIGLDKIKDFSDKIKIFLSLVENVTRRLQSQIGQVKIDLSGDFGEYVEIYVYEKNKKIFDKKFHI